MSKTCEKKVNTTCKVRIHYITPMYFSRSLETVILVVITYNNGKI